MSKSNHWGVGITKLRDEIVGSVCNSHTAPFSKIADINTIMHNEVIQNVKSMAYSTSKSKFFRVKECNGDIKNAIRWMYYKIAIGNMLKTALPNLENQHFHECQLVLWPILLDQTTNTHFLGTLRWVIVFTGSISAPLRPWKTPYHV